MRKGEGGVFLQSTPLDISVDVIETVASRTLEVQQQLQDQGQGKDEGQGQGQGQGEECCKGLKYRFRLFQNRKTNKN